MCLYLILKLFKKPSPEPAPEQVPEPQPAPLELPFPEEKPDFTQTLVTADARQTILAWLIKYNVPAEYWDFWLNSISITVTVALLVAACAWAGTGGKRYLEVRPEWLNPGIIAHEQAHASYESLTETQKIEFALLHAIFKTSDPLIKLLYSINDYGLTSDIEGHAEIYRYLGDKMPETLKQYYPKLF